MARAARANFESSLGEIDTKRLAVLIGGGAATLLVVLFLGFKLFGSKTEAPKPAASPVVKAPQYPQAVTELIAQTEAALKSDDFKAARADVDQLRQIAPSHPRLAFFEGLLAQRADASEANASAAGRSPTTAKRSGKKRSESSAALVPTENSPTQPPTIASRDPAEPHSVPDSASVLAPETPPGMSRAAEAPTEVPKVASAESAPALPAPGQPAEAALPATQAATQAQTAPETPRRTSSAEPPPVVREAKLIRRVNPDYPSAAKRDGIEGSVDLEVTVSANGAVQDVSVVHATPPDVFEKSAVAAVRKWRYDPRYVDGLPSEAHLKVHLEFAPNK